MIPGLPKLNGFVICYMDKKEMESVYKRLKDLKLPEVEVKKSMHTVDAPYPWAIALICKDKKKTDELDNYLSDNSIDLGTMKEIYVGEPRIQEFLFKMLPLDGKFEPGIAKITANECPIGAKSAIIRNVTRTILRARWLSPSGNYTTRRIPGGIRYD